MTRRLYAIGDIHGQRAKLEEVHDRITADKDACGDPAAPVVHLGDLVDRGPDSRGVIERLIAGIEGGEPWHALRGNHDQMFQLFLEGDDDPMMESWLRPGMGGQETLASYGVIAAADRPLAVIRAEARDAVPAAHREFLAALAPWHREGDVLCVHAGIRPGVALEEQSEEDLYWIREEFLSARSPHPWLVLHGHTPVERVTHCGNRVAIDTGAGFGGPLSAVVVEDGAVWLLTRRGRQSVAPGPRGGGFSRLWPFRRS
ncbi:serine/threonine protein phosphatase [Maritimibacter sp. 55A14]|uniref:metallophosphoesterase family protein n=1 Tax=Maritimibacter sp. 55A14 TaxID=2174844 RepID=UPI000D60DF33|nr:metallophosphoesterase family protein [Maritimibacter sp. 55A14]PWE32425.1 serine/threonine protein phosphatase [Maritimibacter sp. 55A14]